MWVLEGFPIDPIAHEASKKFLQFLGPYYLQAQAEGKLATFYDLGFALWADRFFVTNDLNPEYVPWLTQKKQTVSAILPCRFGTEPF